MEKAKICHFWCKHILEAQRSGKIVSNTLNLHKSNGEL